MKLLTLNINHTIVNFNEIKNKVLLKMFEGNDILRIKN